jgi:hypothetical protein
MAHLGDELAGLLFGVEQDLVGDLSSAKLFAFPECVCHADAFPQLQLHYSYGAEFRGVPLERPNRG